MSATIIVELKKRLKCIVRCLKDDSNTITGLSLNARSEKRVAVCYLVRPFTTGFSKPLPNEINIRNIVGIFLELGYVVDIYDHDWTLDRSKKYDLIFGFGRAFESAMYDPAHNAAQKILYLTEMPPNYSCAIERERFAVLRGMNIKLSPKNMRSSSYYRHVQLELADSIIAIGSRVQSHLILTSVNKYLSMLQPSILADKLPPEEYLLGARSLAEFCWIGSAGALVKGLDVLLEAFNIDTEKRLHLFGVAPQDVPILKLAQSNNIINHGFHDIDSAHFTSIVSRCAFVISSSFSEGSSTGVITGMGFGCIPIVSQYCGTEFYENLGVTIQDLSPNGVVDAMNSAISKLGKVTSSDRIDLSNYIRSQYSSGRFRERLSDAIASHVAAGKRSVA